MYYYYASDGREPYFTGVTMKCMVYFFIQDTDAVTKLTKLLPLPQVMSSQKVPHKAVYASVLCQRNQPGDRHRALEMMKEVS